MAGARCTLCQQVMDRTRIKNHQIQVHSFEERWRYRNFRPRGSIFFSDAEVARIREQRGDPADTHGTGRIR